MQIQNVSSGQLATQVNSIEYVWAPGQTLTLPDPDYYIIQPILDLFYPNLVITVPNDTQAIAITSQIAASSSSGLTTIADGGTLSGTYNGNVLCAGSATVTGALTVNGNLYVASNVANQGGFAVTILGDMVVQGMVQFTPSAPCTQGPLLVGNDLRFQCLSMKVLPGESPIIVVGGDMVTLGGNLEANGQDGAPGMTIKVYGDAILNYVALYGGNDTETLAAGRGGSLTCYGDLICYDGIDVYGGGSTYSQGAGDGGEVGIYGDFIGYLNANGGSSSSDAPAGYGGEVWSQGTWVNYYATLNGGDCYSTRSQDYAGGGGDAYADEITGDSPIYMNGGYRGGTLAELNNTTDSPDGGSLQAGGSVYVSHLEMRGGSVDAAFGGNANSSGGSGGELTTKGDVIIYTALLTAGYTQGGQPGGNGGNVIIKGRMSVEYLADISGGAGGSSNGSAGLMTCKSGLTAAQVNALDGINEAAAPTNTCGLFLGGPVQITTLNQVDRDNSVVTAWPDYPVKILLSLGNMPTKQTLNNSGGPTGNINALLGTSIFSYDPSAGWCTLTGTAT